MQDEVKLNHGDSAVIIRHEGEDKGFEIEIYHRPDDELDEEDVAVLRASDSWYNVHTTQDMDAVLDMERESFGDNELVITQH